MGTRLETNFVEVFREMQITASDSRVSFFPVSGAWDGNTAGCPQRLPGAVPPLPSSASASQR